MNWWQITRLHGSCPTGSQDNHWAPRICMQDKQEKSKQGFNGVLSQVSKKRIPAWHPRNHRLCRSLLELYPQQIRRTIYSTVKLSIFKQHKSVWENAVIHQALTPHCVGACRTLQDLVGPVSGGQGQGNQVPFWGGNERSRPCLPGHSGSIRTRSVQIAKQNCWQGKKNANFHNIAKKTKHADWGFSRWSSGQRWIPDAWQCLNWTTASAGQKRTLF